MRMEWLQRAGMNTACPGGIIQENLPASTVIAPVDAYSS
jgi:hypothetical protein